MRNSGIIKTVFFAILFLISSSQLTLLGQQSFRSPLDIPLVLSANFGELRPNHFHSGLDFKTQGVINKKVYAVEAGHVSRIGINAGGYGLVLYVDHPNGKTSVYGHLNSFSTKIAKFVKEEQYKQERYTVDITGISPEKLPVEQGELIALSGNTGSSGGPHVHFEFRDTKSELTLDPLPTYQRDITDNIAPEVRAVAVYPMIGKGIVNNEVTPLRKTVGQSQRSLNDKIEAWGEIGLGIYAIDRMSGTHNIYGVKLVTLYCDDQKIFSSNISAVDFGTTRMINSFTDFDFWKRSKRFYMKSFIEPGNKLDIYDRTKSGYVTIDQEKAYRFRYELEDVHGNVTDFSFIINGKRTAIPKPESCSLVMQWDKKNRYIGNQFSLTIPPYYLYKDINFVLTSKESLDYYSLIYKVHNSYEPLDNYVDMTFRVLADTLENKNQYGVVSIDERGSESWVGGTYKEGYMTARIRELGSSYATAVDILAPEITPVNETRWLNNNRIVIRVKDDKSGIKSVRGTLNGQYALFEHDIKSPNYSYRFDDSKLKKGQKYDLKFIAIDNVGNQSEYEYSFTY